MNQMPEVLVAGEPLDLLVESLSNLKPGKQHHAPAVLSDVVSRPVARAMMRLEARLLVEDADAMAIDDWVERTPAQRRLDALIALGEMVVAEARRVRAR